MDIFGCFTLIGGIALFLFGMNVMGEGLRKQAGSRLRSILERLTSSPLKGALLGLGVTAIIQSSAATIVMVVGFVNSGIMELGQAIGVILGADIGTTVTAWLLSVTGIQGGNFWLNLLKPSSFSPILALIGIVLYMTGKSEKRHNIGTILLGFAVLMFGMQTMSSAVEPLKEVPAFRTMLLGLSNPVLGLLAGAALTAIMQSSSASLGILQAVTATGQVTYGIAFPIIMGANIGTCITAMISSIGTTKNAKRAAWVNLCFKVISVTVCMVIVYVLQTIFQFAIQGKTINTFNIAIIHSLFNIITVALALPFTKALEKLVYLILPEGKNVKEEYQLLDELLLATPTVAVQRSRTLTLEMAHLARESLFQAIDLMQNYDENIAKVIQENESKIDMYEDKLGTYLVKVSGQDLTQKDSSEVSKLLHMIGDFERIGDHAVNLLRSAKEMRNKNLQFSEQAQKELAVLESALRHIVDLSIQAFEENDLNAASRVEPLEQVIDHLTGRLKARHIARLKEGICTIEMGFVFSDLINNFSRTADHCSNIAVCVIQIDQNAFDTHEYLNELKQGGQEDFDRHYQEFKEAYPLPAKLPM